MKILIGYDGSTSADHAIADLARAGIPNGAEAKVLTVADLWNLTTEEITVPVEAPVASVTRESHAAAAEILQAARRLAEKGADQVKARYPSWQVSPMTATDSPAWALVLEADSWQADLIVVGPNRGSNLRGLFMGSVSQLVTSEAHCSVRVARGQGAEPDRPLRIVLGVDGSFQAEVALRTVAAREWPANSDVRIIAAVDPKMHSVAPPEPSPESDDDEPEDYAIASMNEVVEEAAAMLRDLAPSLTVSDFVKVGAPRQVILEEAERWGADCIFVGARGLNRWARFLLGSVSSAIAARAHCSVEVIRPTISQPDQET